MRNFQIHVIFALYSSIYKIERYECIEIIYAEDNNRSNRKSLQKGLPKRIVWKEKERERVQWHAAKRISDASITPAITKSLRAIESSLRGTRLEFLKYLANLIRFRAAVKCPNDVKWTSVLTRARSRMVWRLNPIMRLAKERELPPTLRSRINFGGRPAKPITPTLW